MRILRVIASMDPAAGGPCQGIRNLIPALELQGLRNEVLCLDAPDADFLGSNSFPIHPLGPAKTSWAYSRQLKPWLEANLSNYDVVIQHGLWQYPGYALLSVMRSLRKAGLAPRWYIYPHGMLDPWFQTAESRRIKAMRNWAYWKLIENRVIAAADGLLFTCEEERRLAATTFSPYQPKKTHNVGYGIPSPPDDVSAQQGAFNQAFPHLVEQPFLLFLSRIHPKKGVELLLRAYAALRETSQELPPLMIAGPCADPAYWAELQNLAISLGLQDSAIPFKQHTKDQQPTTTCPPKLWRRRNNQQPTTLWPGMLSGDLKWGALRAASAFVLPSHQENFGIAVVEALACGTPVLISDKVNIWREIEGAGAGLVANDDLTGTTELLKQWLTRTEDEEDKIRSATIPCFQKNFETQQASERLNKAFRSSIESL